MDIDIIIFKIECYKNCNKGQNPEIVCISEYSLKLIVKQVNKMIGNFSFLSEDVNLKICDIRLIGSKNLTNDEIFVR